MMIYYVLYVIILILLIVSLFLPWHQKEGFCGTTGITYDDCRQKLPDDTPLNRQPPFYDLNAVHAPACAYRNYTFPPPLDYSDRKNCLDNDLAKRYMYWYTQPMLSSAETSYTI